MTIKRELIVVAVHGEGDRAKVNANRAALNRAQKIEFGRRGLDAPKGLDDEPDEPGQVTVVLRDDHSHDRIELHFNSWEEIEAWKKLSGWDAEKGHWIAGGKVKLSIGG